MERQNYTSSTKWEPIVGYSRAVKVGPFIEISGTTSTDTNGDLIHDDPYNQTMQIIQNIQKALNHFGAELHHVTRTRIYVKDITHWEQIAKAHKSFFSGIKPATSMVEVNKFISPKILVEIEAQAIVSQELK